MICPSCSIALSPGTHEGVTVHGCSMCSGRFVDFPSLQQILANEERPRSQVEHEEALVSGGSAASLTADAAPTRSCPACATVMTRRVHAYDSGVWIDACDEHGVWLDDGELQRLEAMAEAVRRGGAVRPAEHSASVGMSHNVSAGSSYYDLRVIGHRTDGWNSGTFDLTDLF